MTAVLTAELHVDRERRSRYPIGEITTAGGDQLRFLDPGEGSGRPDVVIVDRPPRSESGAVNLGGSTLISVSSLAVLLSGGWSAANGAVNWVPLLPTLFAPEIVLARRLAANDLGGSGFIDVSIPVGIPTARAWEEDGAYAADELEALVFGMHLVEGVTGDRIEETSILCGSAGVQLYCHRLASGASAIHRLVPTSRLRSPTYRAEVQCAAGRILLRDEFAVGPIGIARDESATIRFPALPRQKLSSQSADTIQGGWEIATLVQHVVTDSLEDSRALQSQVLRLTARSLELVAAN